MHVGILRHRITLQSPTAVADGMGGHTVTWTTVDTVWAAIWPVSAKEQLRADQPAMTVTHRIRLRHRTVGADWRVKYGTRYFAIVSLINVDEANRTLDLLCQEVQA